MSQPTAAGGGPEDFIDGEKREAVRIKHLIGAAISCREILEHNRTRAPELGRGCELNALSYDHHNAPGAAAESGTDSSR